MKWIYACLSCVFFIHTSSMAHATSGEVQQYLTHLKRDIESHIPLSTLKEELHFSAEDIAARGREEIAIFQQLWKGGYYDGNPQDVLVSPFGYSRMKYKDREVNGLYPCYAECIAPYVAGKDVLEIGCGRGGWTKAILSHNPQSVTCLDALSAGHNCFWRFIGDVDNVRYHQVADFSLSEIPDDSLDYVFSFGTFCHISPLLIEEYIKNLYPKLRSGAQCFIMYADYVKYAEHYAAQHKGINKNIFKEDEIGLYKKKPQPGYWYHLGINRAIQMLTDLGYVDICGDIGVNDRDPIMHFVKP